MSKAPAAIITVAALGSKKKEIISFILYVAIPLAFIWVWGSVTIYFVNALYWLIPDRRVEKMLPEG